MRIFAEYLGVPIPSSMVLIVSAALCAFQGRLNLLVVFILALVAASLGDAIWFAIGQMRGEMFIKGYCRLSLGSRDCVRRTREMFSHFPRTSLLLGKFIPGLSTFVVPVAGFSGMTYPHFLFDDSGGIALWAVSMIAIGYTCGEWIFSLGAKAEQVKWFLVAVMAVILTCYYGIKIVRLRKFGRAEMNAVHLTGQKAATP